MLDFLRNLIGKMRGRGARTHLTLEEIMRQNPDLVERYGEDLMRKVWSNRERVEKMMLDEDKRRFKGLIIGKRSTRNG
jgi:hypothetical protein